MHRIIIQYRYKISSVVLGGLMAFMLFSCGGKNPLPTGIGWYIEDNGNYIKVTSTKKSFTLETITDSIPILSKDISFVYVGWPGFRARDINVDLEKVRSAPRFSYQYRYWDEYWDRKQQRYRYRRSTSFDSYQRVSDLMSTVSRRFVAFIQFEAPLYFYAEGGRHGNLDLQAAPGNPQVIRIQPRKPLQPGIYRLNDKYYFAVGEKKRIVQQILNDHLELCEEYKFRQGMARCYKLLLERYPSEYLEDYLVEHFLEPYKRSPILNISNPQSFDVSPDGSTIIFSASHTNNSELYYFHLSKDTLIQITRTEEEEHNPVFSADGKGIAFIRQGKKGYSLCLADSAGDNIRTLSDLPGEAARPLFSPNGRQILFQRIYRTRKGVIYNRHIFAYSVANDTLFQLTSTTKMDEMYVFSPDGKMIAFVALAGKLPAVYLMDNGGENMRRLSPEKISAHHPVFSPDGQFIYYQAQKNKRSDIYQIPLSGGQDRCILDMNRGNYSPLVSADGERLFFLSELGEKEFAIYAMNIKDRQVQRLTYAGMYERFDTNGASLMAESVGDSLFVLTNKRVGLKETASQIHLIDLQNKLKRKKSVLLTKLEHSASVQIREKESRPGNEEKILSLSRSFFKTAFQKNKKKREKAISYMADGADLTFLKTIPYNRIAKIEDTDVSIKDWDYRDYTRITQVRTILKGRLVDYTGLRKHYTAQLALDRTDDGWKVHKIKDFDISF